MRFGIFGAAQADSSLPSAPMGQGFHDFIDFNVEAEALGYHSTFLVEHHFTGWNQVSATLTLLTWLAARTTTLRLGTAVMVLPWHNPVILAEQAAALDLLSEGRLDFGVGKGYRYNEFRGFAIPLEEADARFEEALAIITKAWTSEQRFSHHGRFWTFNDVLVEPPPSQKPHPPFWMAAGSPSSMSPTTKPPKMPPSNVIASSMNAFCRCRAGRTGGSHILAYHHVPEEAEANSLVGTPDEIMGKLEALRRAGVEYVIMSCGGSRESLRRFAHEIMPTFSDEPAKFKTVPA